MEEQSLSIICMTCHKGCWIKEVKISDRKPCITLNCDVCMKNETFEINAYISKFQELPGLDPYLLEKQEFSEDQLGELKNKIEKARTLIKDCQKYKESLKEHFKDFAKKEVSSLDEFIISNMTFLDFLEKLVASYEKNKLDAYLTHNLKHISNLDEIKIPILNPKEGLIAALRIIENFDKAIKENFILKVEYDASKTPIFIKGNADYINIKTMQRIDPIPSEYKNYDGLFHFKSSSKISYKGGDIKLKNGKLLLCSGYQSRIAIYDPNKKSILAESENYNETFIFFMEVSNGDIFTITYRYKNENMLRIFRLKENTLILVKSIILNETRNLLFKNSKDLMYAIKDDDFGDTEGFIELWSLDTQNDYKDMKMLSKFVTHRKVKCCLMNNESKFIAACDTNWYLFDADTLQLILDKKTWATELEGCKGLFKLNDECCFLKIIRGSLILWADENKIFYEKVEDDNLQITFESAIKIEENGENKYLVKGVDHVAEVEFLPTNRKILVRAFFKVAEGFEMFSSENREYYMDPFRISSFLLIRDKRLFYFTSSRDYDNVRLFKY